MAVTMKQIAELAQVSRGTVDRALNNRPGVNEETRKRILEIAASLNYQPNLLGKALSKKQRRFTIGVIIPDGPFFREIWEGMHQAEILYAEYGIRLIFMGQEFVRIEQALGQLDKLLACEIDGLILPPVKSTKIKGMIQKLTQSGKPVITYSSDLPDSSRCCFVGQDAYCAGRVAATLLGKLMRGEGTVLLETSTVGLSGIYRRAEGFADKMRESYPGISITQLYNNASFPVYSLQNMKDYLCENPEISGIFANIAFEDPLLEAVGELNLKDRIPVVTVDALPTLVEAMHAGLVDFTITQNPFQQGYLPIQLMADYLIYGKKPEKEYYFMPIEIRSDENL